MNSLERSGLNSDQGNRFRPPPPTLDFNREQQYYVGENRYDWWQGYEFRDSSIIIDDPLWGIEEIGNQPGDQLLIELAHHPVLQRLRDIEQLTLPREYSTIPNTSAFSRWEHAWGSVILTRRLARQNNLSEEESLKYQVRVLLSDVAHTFGSHLGDWLSQGMGGEEDQHDKELYKYLKANSVIDLLRGYGLDAEDIILGKVPEWVECNQPDLCIDRVDYGLREMRRWIPNESLKHLYKSGNESDLVIQDGKLLMTNEDQAKEFAQAYLELSREHWNDPVHKMQLNLYMQRAKRVIAGGHIQPTWTKFHPRDILYASGSAYSLAMQEHDTFGLTLNIIMSDIIAKYERTTGWGKRLHRVSTRLGLDESSDAYYEDFPPHHPMLDIYRADSIDDQPINGLTINLPSLKPRHIDPTLLTEIGQVRLSDLDPEFKQRLDSYKAEAKVAHIGLLALGNNSSVIQLEQEMEETEKLWQAALSKPRMKPDELRAFVRKAAVFAASSSLIRLDGF